MIRSPAQPFETRNGANFPMADGYRDYCFGLIAQTAPSNPVEAAKPTMLYNLGKD